MEKTWHSAPRWSACCQKRNPRFLHLRCKRDLSASKNIGARFFIRVFIKSLSAKEELLVLAKVPELNRRTSCCLATLINAYAVLCASKAKPEAPAESDAARQSHWVCAVSVVRYPLLPKVAGMNESLCGVWKPRLYSRKRIRRGGFTWRISNYNIFLYWIMEYM